MRYTYNKKKFTLETGSTRYLENYELLAIKLTWNSLRSRSNHTWLKQKTAQQINRLEDEAGRQTKAQVFLKKHSYT